jgi:hypothetical protein
MEELEFFDTKDKEEIKLINTKGKESTDKNDTIIAKIINNRSGITTYKVAFFAGSLYNPGGGYSNREKILKDRFDFKSVSKELFDKYIEFLTTRKLSLFNTINRRIMDG